MKRKFCPQGTDPTALRHTLLSPPLPKPEEHKRLFYPNLYFPRAAFWPQSFPPHSHDKEQTYIPWRGRLGLAQSSGILELHCQSQEVKCLQVACEMAYFHIAEI